MSTWMKTPKGSKEPVWTAWAGGYKTSRGQVRVQVAVEADGSLNLLYQFEDDTGKNYRKTAADKFPDGYTLHYRNEKSVGAVNIGRELSQKIALDVMAVLANGMLIEKTGG